MRNKALKLKLELAAWIIILCGVGYMVGTEVGTSAPPKPIVKTSSASCRSWSIVTTIAFGGKPYVLKQAVVCSDGKITLKGARK